MKDLTQKRCVPCEGGVPPFSLSQVGEYIQYTPGWSLEDENTKITRKFTFKDFAEALAFVNKVGEIAEREGHHPDIKFSWGYALIELSTHAIKGLSENDFILAAKINRLIS
jgi:4a-hydroxytetrahydrobiopterin dehydratase